MRWNPFAKDDSPIASAPPAGPPRNEAVLAAIRGTRAQEVMEDTRPLHRAILAGNFLLPVHQPAEARGGGQTAVRPIEFYNDGAPILVAFTDEEMLRRSMDEEGHLGCGWAPLAGLSLARMAVQGEFSRLILNINTSDSYSLRPLTFGTLAGGFVPAALVSESEHAGEPLRLLASGDGPDPARRPPETLGAGLRRVLELGAESRIVWFESGWAPDELHFNIALDSDEAASRYGEIQTEWIAHWPLPTPLGVHGQEILESVLRTPYGVSL